MLQQDDTPADYVIATGETCSVRDFARMAFDCVDLNYENYLVIDDTLYRSSEVHELRGDFRKAEKALGWTPRVRLHQLIEMMVKADLE